MYHIHKLPWPEWERFALLDLVTLVGAIAFVWLAIHRLPDAHRHREAPAQRRSPMTPHLSPAIRSSSKHSPPKRGWALAADQLTFLSLLALLLGPFLLVFLVDWMQEPVFLFEWLHRPMPNGTLTKLVVLVWGFLMVALVLRIRQVVRGYGGRSRRREPRRKRDKYP
jgi:hypothetical protein